MRLSAPEKLLRQRAEVQRLDRDIASTVKINTALPPKKAERFERMERILRQKRQIAYFRYSQSLSKFASK